jgi:hypothetical protein
MILLRRILPFIAPLFLGACILGILFRPLEWQQWLKTIAILVILSLAFMMKWEWRRAHFWGTLFPAVVTVSGGVSLLFFLHQPIYQWVVSILVVIIYGLYLENVFTYQYQPIKYTSSSLPNMSLFMNTFGAFGLATAGYGMVLVEIIQPWMLTVGAFVFSIALLLHIFWSYQVDRNKRLVPTILSVFIITEMVWVLHFWPTAYFVNGVMVGILIYGLPTIMQLQLRGTLKRSLWLQYAIISIVALIIVAFTAQWT